MPNKYSHAFVLSQYEARGLVDLHNHPARPPSATSSILTDRPRSQHRQNFPPVTRAPPAPSSGSMKTTSISTSTPRSVVVSKPTAPTTSAPHRAVFDDSPPSSPDPLHFHLGYKHAAQHSRARRRLSSDQKAPPPITTAPPTSSRGYKHITSATPGPPRSSFDYKHHTTATKAPARSTPVLKELPRDVRTQPSSCLEIADARPTTSALPPSSSNLEELPRTTRSKPALSLDVAIARQTITAPPFSSTNPKELPRNNQPSLSLDSKDARPNTTGPQGSSTGPQGSSPGSKELSRNAQPSYGLSMALNNSFSTTASSTNPRPRTAGATPGTTSRPTSRPRTLTTTRSFQSSGSSHHTTDSVSTQIFAPEPTSPSPTVPRSSASFETAIFFPEPASPPKVLSRREPPAIPPRSSSIPRPPSSSIHYPDFDGFSSVNSPTMSSTNSTTFSRKSSFHQTPRTSYSQLTNSFSSKSSERGPEFNPDQAPAPDPETVPFSREFDFNPWENPDDVLSIFRPSISSDENVIGAPFSRSSSFDEAAPPPITRTPRTQCLPPAAAKKPRRLSFTLARPDCETIAYHQALTGPAPIRVSTAKDATIQERNSGVIEREYMKRSSKRTSWSVIGRMHAVKDPFEDKTRGRRFSRAGGV